MKKYLILSAILLLTLAFFAKGKKVKNSIQLNEGVFNYLNSNRVFYWFANNGLSANDPSTGGNGLFWSDDASIGKGTIFADGLVWGGIVNGLVSCGGSTYRTGMIPGPYPKDNEFIDRTSSKYRIYKIRKDLNNVPQNLVWQYKKDYDEWPVELGAPWIDVNGDGVFTKGVDEPEILGDETAWFVMNDSDTTQSMFIYGAPPMGLEVQVTLWSFDHFNFLGDAVFRKYKIINKGNSEIKDMYVGIWSDPDLGAATDDFVGCDTSLSLGYSYNGLDVDEVYGIPPAAGYVLLETPTVDSKNDSALINGSWKKGYKNLPLTGFSLYIGGSSIYMDPSMGVIRGSHDLYNQMQGKIWDGSPYIDPTTGDTTNFCLAGDPVNKSGWYEGEGWPGGASPGDRRFLLSAGKFDLMPGDTQFVVFAELNTRAEDRISSLHKLKTNAKNLRDFYNRGMRDPIELNPPSVYHSVTDSSIILSWESEQENISVIDSSKFYGTDEIVFEGYLIFQYENEKYDNPILIGKTDLDDNVKHVFPISSHLDLNAKIDLDDTGLIHNLELKVDQFTGGKFVYGKNYYFGITPFASNLSTTAYGYRSYLIPGKTAHYSLNYIDNGIDDFTEFNLLDTLVAEKISGAGDGEIRGTVLNPSALNGKTLEFIITSGNRAGLFNRTDSQFVAKDIQFFYESNKIDFYGIQWLINNTGRKNLLGKLSPTPRTIKSVEEIAGPVGNYPQNVFYNINSSGKWYISSMELPTSTLDDSINNIGTSFHPGTYDYEIVFNGEGSEYYIYDGTASSISAVVNKAQDRVPFQVWRIPNNTTIDSVKKRLMIVVYDYFNPDGKWSKDSQYRWDGIFAFLKPNDEYIEPLPNSLFVGNLNINFGNLIINGEMPVNGTTIRINTWKPLSKGDVFSFTYPKYKNNDLNKAKSRMNEISVFPNPLFLSSDNFNNGVNSFRFAKLPNKVVIRIYSLGGFLIKKIEKNDLSSSVEWDLTDLDNHLVTAGIYVVHLEMPGIGEKIMKIALVY